MRVRWLLGPVTQGPMAQGPRAQHRVAMAPELVAVVESRSGGEPHRVSRTGAHWSCTCKAYSKGGLECWAVKQERDNAAQGRAVQPA